LKRRQGKRKGYENGKVDKNRREGGIHGLGKGKKI